MRWRREHELGLVYATLVKAADHVQIYKYVTQMVAQTYGKTATFMPKPVAGDNGSGMHTHLSIWKDGKPLFTGSGYAELSDMAIYDIGGIIKHAKALNAFTNPTTNSYKRLDPGLRSARDVGVFGTQPVGGCRIPYSPNPKGKHIKVRFPDPSCNPYLAFAAMRWLASTGSRTRSTPATLDKNLYDLPPEKMANVPTVCGSLREAIGHLDADRDFLKRGDVFSDDVIDGYIELKWEEIYNFEHTPHPVEFQMYYSS